MKDNFVILDSDVLLEIIKHSTSTAFNNVLDLCIKIFEKNYDKSVKDEMEKESFSKTLEKNLNYIDLKLHSIINEEEVSKIVYELSNEEVDKKYKNAPYQFRKRYSAYTYINYIKCNDNKIYIFTSRPSFLIGEKGKLIDNIINKIKEITKNDTITIKIIETK